MKDLLEKLTSFIIGQGRDLSSEDNRRFLLIIVIGLLASIVLIGIAVASLLGGEPLTALVDFLACILLLTVLAFYRWSSYEKQCRYIGVALMYTLYLYLFFTHAANGTTYMWHYTFPFFAIFIIGSRHGSFATIFLFIPVFIAVIQDALTPESGMYSAFFAIRFIPSVSVALIFAFLFEKERERFRSQSIRAYQEQESIIAERSEQLNLEIAAKEQIKNKLRHSQKMEAIGTMASGVAHDLNNILSGLVGYPQLIRSNLPTDSPFSKPLKAIEQAGIRAAAVVNDLLTLARDAASVKELVDLNKLIVDLLDSPEWQAFITPHPDLKIVVNLAAKQAVAKCSVAHIRKSIMNLLINAAEATLPRGKVTISTTNRLEEEFFSSQTTKQIIFISIEDEGTGIAADHIDHIFEPFYTTKKMGRSGSGLGLSVVWNSIEEHQGEIIVLNTTLGARFIFYLKILENVAIPHQQTKFSIEEFKGTGHILIIDDEPQLAKLAHNIICKLGYTGITVETGEKAIHYIKSHHVDLILLDMVLGDGLSGYETYREIIKIKPHQKAIIVSGYSTSEDVRKTLDLGARKIIKKPYTIAEMGKTIKDSFEEI